MDHNYLHSMLWERNFDKIEFRNNVNTEYFWKNIVGIYVWLPSVYRQKQHLPFNVRVKRKGKMEIKAQPKNHSMHSCLKGTPIYYTLWYSIWEIQFMSPQNILCHMTCTHEQLEPFMRWDQQVRNFGLLKIRLLAVFSGQWRNSHSGWKLGVVTA